MSAVEKKGVKYEVCNPLDISSYLKRIRSLLRFNWNKNIRHDRTTLLSMKIRLISREITQIIPYIWIVFPENHTVLHAQTTKSIILTTRYLLTHNAIVMVARFLLNNYEP
jgi:hypothetical protein